MLFHLLWRMGAFLCQHETSKIKNTTVRNSFSAVVYTACNIIHTIKKPVAALSVSSENFFLLLLRNKMYMCCIFRLEEEAFWANSWQNQQNDPCAQQRLRSAWALPPSLIRVFALRSVSSFGPEFASGGQRRLWSDSARRSFCWLCHAVAQFSYWNHFRKYCVLHFNEFAYV